MERTPDDYFRVMPGAIEDMGKAISGEFVRNITTDLGEELINLGKLFKNAQAASNAILVKFEEIRSLYFMKLDPRVNKGVTISEKMLELKRLIKPLNDFHNYLSVGWVTLAPHLADTN